MSADPTITSHQEVPPAGTAYELAIVRTMLALDRTQLAWVRTTFTFISIGFAVDKGTEALHQARLLAGTNWVKGSHFTGLTLTIFSTLILLGALISYGRRMRELATMAGRKPPLFPPCTAPSLLVLAMGAALTILLASADDPLPIPATPALQP